MTSQVGEHIRPPESRRHAQWRRRLLAEMEERDEGTPPWPKGRGRRPGSQGKRVRARQDDLFVRFRGLEGPEQDRFVALRSDAARRFVREHAERHGMSIKTAERDWFAVRRRANEQGFLGVAHLGAKGEQLMRPLTLSYCEGQS